MDLLIHTTTWWGDHPSMVYYSEVRTTPRYSVKEFQGDINSADINDCFIAEKADWKDEFGLWVLSKNEKFVLGVKE